jgi:hypothetical protein
MQHFTLNLPDLPLATTTFTRLFDSIIVMCKEGQAMEIIYGRFFSQQHHMLA